MKRADNNEKGFTVIELLIASAIFSVVLLVCLSAFVVIGRMYFKGITITRTQSTTRSIIDDISRGIQFSNAKYSVAANTICIGGKRYTYTLYKEINSSPNAAYQTIHGLQREDNYTSTGCSPAAVDAQGMVAGSTELLPDGMQLDAFSLTDVSGDNKLWKVHVKVVSGNNIPGNAIITGANGSKQCVITSGSSQFCAVSDLTTIIMGRL